MGGGGWRKKEKRAAENGRSAKSVVIRVFGRGGTKRDERRRGRERKKEREGGSRTCIFLRLFIDLVLCRSK